MPRPLAVAVVALASAAVLVLELMAARLLAPYVGVTLETYTAVIGVVLLAIAVGNWYGGRLADAVDPRRLVGPALAVGGGLALFSVPVLRLLGDGLRGGGVLAVVALVVVAFFAPAAVLSTVTPAVAKLRLRRLEETGTVVGRLGAASTGGAIAGTFLTGFVLVAELPSTPIVLGTGVVLVLVGAALSAGLGRTGAGAGAVALALLAGVPPIALAVALDDGCDVETRYFCARVVPDPDDPGGRLLLLDGLRHAWVDLDDPTHLRFGYVRTFADLAAGVRPGESLRALHVGGGGFTFPRYLAAVRPGTRSTVLELDPGVVAIGRERLGLVSGPDLRVRTGDARLTLLDEPQGLHDLVVGDAFASRSVPWHLTTREFVREVRARLRPGGLYVLNLIDGPPLAFARAEAATLAEAFEHVVLVAAPDVVRGARVGNLVLAASDRPVDVAALRRRLAARSADEVVLAGPEIAAFVRGADVLRDDHAPVDQLLGWDG